MVGDLDLEVVQPVAEAPRIAQGICELSRRDPVRTGGPFFQPDGVAVQPAMDMLAQAQLHQRLGGHRPVVRKVSIEFGAGAVQPFIRLVEHSGPVEIGCLHIGTPPAVERFIHLVLINKTSSCPLEVKSRR